MSGHAGQGDLKKWTLLGIIFIKAWAELIIRGFANLSDAAPIDNLPLALKGTSYRGNAKRPCSSRDIALSRPWIASCPERRFYADQV
jgi:hypothetical protein